VNAEELAFVGPDPSRDESRVGGQLSELFDRVFVRVLGADRFAFCKVEDSAGGVDELPYGADQLHLDAPFTYVVEGPVPETGEVEVAADLAVDAREKVQIEGGSDALLVVVGGVQNVVILLEIDTDEKAVPPAAQACDDLEELPSFGGLEVADGRAGK
jgi:hypothetical protein